MGRAKQPDRVTGPYRDAKGWTIFVYIDGERRRIRCRGCASEEEAQEFAAGAADRLCRPEADTIEDAVMLYIEGIGIRNAAESVTFEMSALWTLTAAAGRKNPRRFAVQDFDHFVSGLASASSKTGRPLSMATRKSYTKAGFRFCTWLNRRGFTQRDIGADWKAQQARLDKPMAWKTRQGTQELNRGKDQLRNESEAKAYLDTALQLTTPGHTPVRLRPMIASERRVAACLPLLCGLRSGEVLHLRVGDIDLAAATGYIRNAPQTDGWHVKTASSARIFSIPEALRQDLLQLVNGQAADAYLFRERNRSDRLDQPRARSWLNDLVHFVCQQSAVGVGSSAVPIKVVTAHGLRGTYASLLASMMSVRLGDIASVLGHSDAGQIARQAYIGAPVRTPTLTLLTDNFDHTIDHTEKATGNGR